MIVALWSGITAEEYDRLSLIAPVVAVPKGIGDYAMPWDDRALLTGRAVGREDLAEDLVASVRGALHDVAADHPEWNGLGAAVAYLYDGSLGAYTSQDVRPQLLAELVFQPPAEIDALITGNDFAVTFSPEDLSAIDTDLLIWLPPQGGDFSPILDLPARRFLNAAIAGHEIFLEEELSGAFSHASLLSIPYAIDRLVPMIEATLAAEESR